MSDFVSTAIIGTGQLADAARDLTLGPADDLVARVASPDRERAFLLRAGARAVLRRGASLPDQAAPSLTPAPEEVLPACGPRLTELLTQLMTDGPQEILEEALGRMAKRGLRLAPELLPLALAESDEDVRALLRPVLGARGAWLAGQRPESRWAANLSIADETLPVDFDERWAEGTAAERRSLLAIARRSTDDRGRSLVTAAWKQEKAEQRLAWLDVLEDSLSADDEPLLAGMLGDRSSQVRVAAARLLWKLPESAVACAVRDRVTGLFAFHRAPSGLLDKLKAVVGALPSGTLGIELPPEEFDAAWEKEGIVQNPPQGVGRRQWWLEQMLSAVPPDHWAVHFQASPAEWLDAALVHDLAGVLLEGLTEAALRHESAAWVAPLWDGWLRSELSPRTEGTLEALAERLSPSDAEERALALLDRAGVGDLLASFPVPWSGRLSQAMLSRLGEVRPSWSELLPVAALAIPVELLPDLVPIPEVAATDYAARKYVRALEQFQTWSVLRRSIAKETPP